ncbi:hypothetical protein BRC81_07665 [Halobacteriales archaeon QS_1_68_20]|nr:MAG: hypothetical protein BRC81_07665 [Halobacteriales archaeon QS_1_68_20]
MNVTRELLTEWGVPIVATVLFILAVGAVGAAFGADGLSQTGAFALVGVIVAFVVGMAILGFVTSDGDDEE